MKVPHLLKVTEKVSPEISAIDTVYLEHDVRRVTRLISRIRCWELAPISGRVTEVLPKFQASYRLGICGKTSCLNGAIRTQFAVCAEMHVNRDFLQPRRMELATRSVAPIRVKRPSYVGPAPISSAFSCVRLIRGRESRYSAFWRKRATNQKDAELCGGTLCAGIFAPSDGRAASHSIVFVVVVAAAIITAFPTPLKRDGVAHVTASFSLAVTPLRGVEDIKAALVLGHCLGLRPAWSPGSRFVLTRFMCAVRAAAWSPTRLVRATLPANPVLGLLRPLALTRLGFRPYYMKGYVLGHVSSENTAWTTAGDMCRSWIELSSGWRVMLNSSGVRVGRLQTRSGGVSSIVIVSGPRRDVRLACDYNGCPVNGTLPFATRPFSHLGGSEDFGSQPIDIPVFTKDTSFRGLRVLTHKNVSSIVCTRRIGYLFGGATVSSIWRISLSICFPSCSLEESSTVALRPIPVCCLRVRRTHQMWRDSWAGVRDYAPTRTMTQSCTKADYRSRIQDDVLFAYNTPSWCYLFAFKSRGMMLLDVLMDGALSFKVGHVCIDASLLMSLDLSIAQAPPRVRLPSRCVEDTYEGMVAYWTPRLIVYDMRRHAMKRKAHPTRRAKMIPTDEDNPRDHTPEDDLAEEGTRRHPTPEVSPPGGTAQRGRGSRQHSNTKTVPPQVEPHPTFAHEDVGR
ncbi:hypothetical protein BDZ89DRAFT_1040560 [Hymenopellis radicata]|nr:hypothetical protein BDZ89DRAFT_1040560 [Hymenopellis radicata]